MGKFLDVKKPFDSVNHDILLRKLNYARIHGTANNLFRTYLTNRSQKFKINDVYSQSLNKSHEVGSTLGNL